ncbi:intracellular septation protein [Afipia sp. P52-10]|uniref:inner membrane-spanning protein YciB n=1 Tax=Afipia sp. P52-10 TaxID=1429916 RepID=UPI0003DF0EFE|nr:septation protein IspZ [Afipia sp. P52-10]ETR78383.1 intracellular septation protein [Afipia sp. P52-10]
MQIALRQLFLDFLSAIVFLLLYALTNSLAIATGLAVAVSVAQVAIAKMRGQHVDAMQWLVLGLVLVLGAVTLITHDSRFIMIKPSLVHGAIGIVMLRPGWMGRYLPKVATENLSQRFIINAGYCWAALMFVLAIANVIVATSFGFRVWGWFVSVGLIGAKLVAFFIQYAIMRMAVRKRRAAASQTA